MRVAFVYDRVNKWGGAERVLLALHEIFPDAPLFTSVYSPQKAVWAEVFPSVIPSFLQNIPKAKNHHEYLAPLMPFVFESFDFSGYELVISVSSEAAKGIITGPNTKHICYCLTPTRYLWSGYDEYFTPGKRSLARPLTEHLKRWDLVAASRPDKLVAISKTVRSRIQKYYRRDSEVIYPPLDPIFTTNTKQISRSDYYLVVSRLVPYKRTDLAIHACSKLGRQLIVVGSGSDMNRLKRIAGKNVKFTGEVDDATILDYYGKSRALLFPQFEDFGLTAVEAQSQGTPVIAYNKGGARETVIKGVTGVFFNEQIPEALASAITEFEGMNFTGTDIIRNAARFSRERFFKEFGKITKNI